MNDLIHLICEMAVREFGSPNIFNAACFAKAFKQVSGLQTLLDGRAVRVILAGRGDIEVLSGAAHYRLIELTGEL